MKNNVIKFFCSFFIFTVFALYLPTKTLANQHLISDIQIIGNNRVDSSTIIAYSDININDTYTSLLADETLRTLYQTNLFSDVKIEYLNTILTIIVVENYVVNRVAFEGNKSLDDDTLAALVSIKPRSSYSRRKVQDNIEKIISSYRAAGLFSVSIDPKIIILDYNRIDLVFEITEGPVTKISNINFIGNKNFSDKALISALATKKSNFIDSLFGTGRSYDNDIMSYDKELLKRFYNSNGYVNFEVVNAVAELDNNAENFFITFTVVEGEKYNFGKVDIQNNISNLPLSNLVETITTISGDKYSSSEIDTSIEMATDKLGELGFAFVFIEPSIVQNTDNRTIDLTYTISDGPRVYVERIDIFGNQRTYDYVVRREMELAEGDALNMTYLEKSRRNLKNINLFSSVDVSTISGTERDKKIIIVRVAEQSTGSLSFGAGFSSEFGIAGTVSVTERNFLGKGQYVAFDTNLSADKSLLNISFIEPSLNNSPVLFGFDLYGQEFDTTDSSGYVSSTIGAGIKFGLPLSKNLNLNTSYSYKKREIYGIPDSASVAVKQTAGTSNESTIGYGFTYNNLNNSLDPTDGMKISFEQDLAGIGGDVKYLSTELSGAYFEKITDNLVGNLQFNAGHMHDLGNKGIAIGNAFKDPGGVLRGFAPGGISPRDNSTKDAFGGNTYYSTSAEVTFPIPGIPPTIGISGGVNVNAGSLYNSDVVVGGVTVLDSNSLRTSAGATIFWASPIGPLRFDFTEAIDKQSYDKVEFFQFSGGTQF